MADERTDHLKHGSASLFIVVLMSIVAIYLGVVWKTTSYVTDFVAQQEQLMRAQTSYYALQHYVVAFVKSNFDKLITDLQYQKHPIDLAFDWPPETKQKKHAARLQLALAGDTTIVIDAQYMQDKFFSRRLHATIQKLIDEDTGQFFKIGQWQPHA